MMLRSLDEVWRERAEEARQWMQACLLRLPGTWRLRPIQVALGAMMGTLELVRVCVIGWGGAGLSKGSSDVCSCPTPKATHHTLSWAEVEVSWALKQLCKPLLNMFSYSDR